VNQTGRVCDVKRLGDRCKDPQGAAGVQLARDDHVLQVGPPDKPHSDEEAVLARTRLVDRDDVRVLHACLDLSLAHEALAEQDVVAEVRRKHLECNGPVERDLSRLVHDPHPALPKDARDLVSG
jgi:hypothetical protein